MSSRMEEHLKACINKTGTAGLGRPQSRSEELLQELAVTIQEGGSGGGTNAEEVNEIVEEHLSTKSAVPNSGYVDKVYFNTSLSVDETVEELSKITYSEEYDDYTVLITSDYSNGIVIILFDATEYGYSEGTIYTIANNKLEPIFSSHTFTHSHKGEILQGWHLESLEINAEVLSEDSGTSIGTQNDLIKDLVYVQNEKYATVEKVESYLYTPTAILNKEFVDTVYFNTNLSAEEVDNYLSKLTYVDFNGMSVNVLFTNETGTNILLVFKDGDKYEIFHATSIDGSGYTQIYYTDKGWLLDKFEINDFGVSELMGLSIGAENDIIKDVVYTMNEKYTTEEKVEKVVESYLFTEEEPTALLVDGTTLIDKVYFNTSKTEEEVVDILNSITYVGGIYTAFMTGDKKTALAVWSSSGSYGIEVVNVEKNETVFVSGTDSFGFTGWNPNITNPFTLNAISITENTDDLGTYVVGDQNELLKDLISMTPFGKQEFYTTPKKVESYLFTKDVAVVPNEGYVESVKFNTNLSYDEVLSILNSISYTLNDGTVEGVLIGISFDSTGSLSKLVQIAITNNGSGSLAIQFAEMTASETKEIFIWASNEFATDNNLTAGWQEFTNPIEINIEVTSEFEGMIIGTQNELLKDLVYCDVTNYHYTPYSEFKEVKDKTENIPFIIEKTTTEETIEEAVSSITITYEEAISLADAKSAVLKIKQALDGGTITIEFIKFSTVYDGEGYMLQFIYWTGGVLYNLNLIAHPNSTTASMGVQSSRFDDYLKIDIAKTTYMSREEASQTYATKSDLDNYMTESDVLQEIENYMSTNYENGNEGSY